MIKGNLKMIQGKHIKIKRNQIIMKNNFTRIFISLKRSGLTVDHSTTVTFLENVVLCFDAFLVKTQTLNPFSTNEWTILFPINPVPPATIIFIFLLEMTLQTLPFLELMG